MSIMKAGTILPLLSVFRPPLWFSSQSSWLQIQRPGFHSRRYLIFWEVVCVEGGPLSLVSTIKSYSKEKVAAPVWKTDITAVRFRRADHSTTLCKQNLALTSPTSGGRSVGIVRSRTKGDPLNLCQELTSYIHTLNPSILIIAKNYWHRFNRSIRILNDSLHLVSCIQ
jgi:hypothetical protein